MWRRGPLNPIGVVNISEPFVTLLLFFPVVACSFHFDLALRGLKLCPDNSGGRRQEPGLNK